MSERTWFWTVVIIELFALYLVFTWFLKVGFPWIKAFLVVNGVKLP